jgi:hypothetical protein
VEIEGLAKILASSRLGESAMPDDIDLGQLEVETAEVSR